MSSINCQYCGLTMLDSRNGYVTQCEHYPNKEGFTTCKDRYCAVGRQWGVCSICEMTIHPLLPHVFCREII